MGAVGEIGAMVFGSPMQVLVLCLVGGIGWLLGFAVRPGLDKSISESLVRGLQRRIAALEEANEALRRHSLERAGWLTQLPARPAAALEDDAARPMRGIRPRPERVTSFPISHAKTAADAGAPIGAARLDEPASWMPVAARDDAARLN